MVMVPFGVIPLCLYSARLLTAASIDAPAELEVLTREMWKRLWGGGGDIASAQVHIQD